MHHRLLCFTSLIIFSLITLTSAAADPLAAWKPNFDPAGAEHTYLLSCVGHPAIEGVAVGFRIRDRNNFV